MEMDNLLHKLQNDLKCPYLFNYFDEKRKNPYEWKTVLVGPYGSIYENGFYLLKIVFPESYPNNRPNIYFVNKIFHPHIHSSGNACIIPPFIKDEKNDIISLLDGLRCMILHYDAYVDHGYSEEPRFLFCESRDKFIEKAKEWVKLYAKREDIEKLI